MKVYNIGIIGCGTIAARMAKTLNGMKGVNCYAVASRSLDKAKVFAQEWHFQKAYYQAQTPAKSPMRYIRLRMTGPSHRQDYQLLCSFMELFGGLFE